MTKIKTNRNNTNNVPPLRFPEFSGEWRYSSLGNECDILCGYPFDGQDMQESYGNVKLLRGINITEGEIRHSNELDRYYSGDISRLGKYILKEGDLVIGMDGSKVGRNSAILTIYEQGSYLVQRVCRIRSQKHNVEYIFQHINNSKFHKYVDSIKTASAIPHISQSDIQDYTISFPPTAEEQIKITSLLSLLDARISTQNKIIEKYESLIQAIIYRKKVDGMHNGNWQKTELSKVLKERYEKNTDGHVVCSVSVSQGVVNQIEYLGRSFAAKETSHYNVVNYGDIVYTKSPTGNFPYGIVKRSCIQNAVAVSPLYGVYKPVSDSIGVILHFYFMQPNHAFNYLHPLIQKGAKNTINITNTRFLENSIPLPKTEHEAVCIANALTGIQRKIEIEKNLLCLYEKEKQHLLGQMFI